jgi:hypothetical protein
VFPYLQLVLVKRVEDIVDTPAASLLHDHAFKGRRAAVPKVVGVQLGESLQEIFLFVL